eukprot:TRINITY_DN5025_c0_g1_i1.p1 TRINITY_DN5025_c0_g1~~TRINITY_DN5025_c0_g1_i1.p1  ORF type:complete len:402 (-),score=92.06 TRINITY_DN5025_c0_g1_i1:1007-2212(-)
MDENNPPSNTRVIRIPPYHYLHVLNRNTIVTRLEVGPQSFLCKEHERLVLGPAKMITIPPRHYCIIKSPVVRDQFADGKSEVSKKSFPEEQVRLKHGEKEIRFENNEPFPLYPGEILEGDIRPLQIVGPNQALRLRANRDFTEQIEGTKDTKQRKAGEEWLFEGPNTYIPRIEVDIAATVACVIIKPNQALKLSAKHAFVDSTDTLRLAGETWLYRKEGAFLPGIEENIVGVVDAIVLTEHKALQLMATKSFTDVFGKERKAGEEWLITLKDKETHILDIYEQLVREIDLISLSSREYCTIHNPVDENGIPQIGQKKRIRGEAHFFLQPGEGATAPRPIEVLGEEEAFLVRCTREFEDEVEVKGAKTKVRRIPGQSWMVNGPREFVPPLGVHILQRKKALL